MIDFKEIFDSKFNFKHFIVALLIISGLSIGLLVLTYIIGWLNFMEPAAGPRMFSNLTIFGLFTFDLLLILLLILRLFLKSANKGLLDYCKNYFIIGVIYLLIYMTLMPYNIITNP